MNMNSKSTKRLRLSLAVLSLASATAVFQPQSLLAGSASESASNCSSCNNGTDFCKTVVITGISVSCFKH